MENNNLKSFRDLKVWQKAADLATLIYKITEKFPGSELYGLTSQMKRASVSISSNIVEGFKRNHKKEKLQLYNVAYSSAAELESQIEIAKKLHFLQEEDYQQLVALIVEINKMTEGLIKSYRNFYQSIPLKVLLTLAVLYPVSCVLYPQHAEAAEVYFGTTDKTFQVGEKFEIGVFLDTQGEFINAVEGDILFPKDTVDFQGVLNGGSVVSLWVQQPYLEKDGIAHFSGVTPGGFIGNKGYLFSLFFTAKEVGSVNIASDGEKILLNDGSGSAATVSKAPIALKIIEVASNSQKSSFLPLYDPNPPAPFQLYVSRSPEIFSGKWFLSFLTQDKESGIDHYEVFEKPQPGSIVSILSFGQEEWVKAESPYLLEDQNLESVILVKSFDRAGNTTMQALPPQRGLSWYKNTWLWVIILSVMAIIAGLFVFVKRKMHLEQTV